MKNAIVDFSTHHNEENIKSFKVSIKNELNSEEINKGTVFNLYKMFRAMCIVFLQLKSVEGLYIDFFGFIETKKIDLQSDKDIDSLNSVGLRFNYYYKRFDDFIIEKLLFLDLALDSAEIVTDFGKIMEESGGSPLDIKAFVLNGRFYNTDYKGDEKDELNEKNFVLKELQERFTILKSEILQELKKNSVGQVRSNKQEKVCITIRHK